MRYIPASKRWDAGMGQTEEEEKDIKRRASEGGEGMKVKPDADP